MATLKSAKKRIRQNEKRRLRNRRRKEWVKEGVRAFQDAIEAGQADQAAERLKEVYRRLDRVAVKGAIHRKNAARSKARLARQLNVLAG